LDATADLLKSFVPLGRSAGTDHTMRQKMAQRRRSGKDIRKIKSFSQPPENLVEQQHKVQILTTGVLRRLPRDPNFLDVLRNQGPYGCNPKDQPWPGRVCSARSWLGCGNNQEFARFHNELATS